MPFMKGQSPIRRTLRYLESGKLVLKPNIKIFSVNYNSFGEEHSGARDFVFWNLPQVQYKNPSVQVITFKNMTPSPFIKCFYENGENIIVDIDDKNKESIVEHLIKVMGKSKSLLDSEMKFAERKHNPANFGVACDRGCICEIAGQVPCPGIVPLPMHLRGKQKYQQV